MADSPMNVDGRNRRAELTRKLVIDAYTELLLEGNLKPTFDDVAERANVSRRTVFNNFRDHDGLVSAVSARSLAIALADFESISPALPLDERIKLFTRRRTRILERIAPLSRSLQISIPFSEALQNSRSRHFVRVRQEIEHLFAAELGRGTQRELLVSALLAATSATYWTTLRDDLGIGVRRAADIMRTTIEGLLHSKSPQT